MAFVPCPNTVECTIVSLWRGQIVENTLWFQLTAGTLDASTVSVVTADVDSWFSTTYLTLVSNEVEYLRTIGVDQSDPAGGGFQTASGAGNGGAPTPSPPNNCTIAIAFKTGFRGRSFAGRNYIVGIPGTLVSGNAVDASFRDDMRSAYESLGGIVGAHEFAHVVASRFSGSTIVGGKKVPTPRAEGIMTPVLSYVFTDEIIDSQRRRLPGRGS